MCGPRPLPTPPGLLTNDKARPSLAKSSTKPLPLLPIDTSTRKVSPRPTCTHLNMDKFYTSDEACYLCNRIPTLGWLYACQQDTLEHEQYMGERPPSRKKLVHGKDRRVQNELEALGFSKSIVDAVAKGHYSDMQVEALKEQKRGVLAAIEVALAENEDLKARRGASPALLSEKLSALKSIPEERDERQQTLVEEERTSRPKHKKPVFSKALLPCDFKVCHTCRPGSRDRTFISFEAVFKGEVSFPQGWVPKFMPIADANILRDLDYIYDITSDEEDDDLYESEYDDMKNIADAYLTPPDSGIAEQGEWSPPQTMTTPESGGSWRRSWQKDLVDILGRHEAVPRASTTSFNVQLWKNLSNEELAKAAATKLPGRDSDDDPKDHDAEGHLLEQHVHGGLALTEEAIETDSPDIITSV
jgi:hypothetical protein